MRERTSWSQRNGSSPTRWQVATKLRSTAAVLPPWSLPKKTQLFRPTAKSIRRPERGILCVARCRGGLMRYVLNSAVISRPGNYEYKLLTELEAEVWLKQDRFVSRVG